MSRFLRTVLPLGLLGLLGLTGTTCYSPLGPQDVAGTYVLERIGDSTLPAVFLENPDVTYEVLADTFRIGLDHTAVEARVARTEPHSGAAPTAEHSRTEFLYRLSGSRIVLDYPPCPDGVSCPLISRVAPPTGYLIEDGMVIENEPLFIYRRID